MLRTIIVISLETVSSSTANRCVFAAKVYFHMLSVTLTGLWTRDFETISVMWTC